MKYGCDYKGINNSFVIKRHLGGLGRYDVPYLVIRQSSWKNMREVKISWTLVVEKISRSSCHRETLL